MAATVHEGPKSPAATSGYQPGAPQRPADRADGGQPTQGSALIGWLYANGQGVARDYAEAARWYRLAADQGIAEAQFNLARLTGAGPRR